MDNQVLTITKDLGMGLIANVNGVVLPFIVSITIDSRAGQVSMVTITCALKYDEKENYGVIIEEIKIP